MAKTPAKEQGSDTQQQVDPEKVYRVRVRRAVPIGKHGYSMLLPYTDNRVSGAVLATLPQDAIVSSEEVTTT